MHSSLLYYTQQFYFSVSSIRIPSLKISSVPLVRDPLFQVLLTYVEVVHIYQSNCYLPFLAFCFISKCSPGLSTKSGWTSDLSKLVPIL
jgi:hypothetical protein